MEVERIQYHPAFCSAAELEFRENASDLEFESEVNLSKKPLQIDLLIIKKNKDLELENSIGKIFKEYNSIEYKSPDDGLDIDDFFKVVGYACFYKAQSKASDFIKETQITVSFVRHSMPMHLFARLKNTGYKLKEEYPGIYYLTGKIPFEAQIIVTSKLSSEHSVLKILTTDASEKDVRTFLSKVNRLNTKDDKENIDAVLHVSMRANPELYQGIKEDKEVCEELRKLMEPEIKEAVEKAVEKAVVEASAVAAEKTAAESAEKAARNLFAAGVNYEIVRATYSSKDISDVKLHQIEKEIKHA